MNERRRAEDILSSVQETTNPIHNVYLLSRYYYAQGMRQKEVLEKIEDYLRQFPFLVLPKWQQTVDKIVAKAKGKGLIEIEYVGITEKELSEIAKLRKESLKKLAFTLLCIAKYFNTIRPENSSWVNTPDKDVFRMADIRTLDSKRQQKLIRELHLLGLVGYSKVVDNVNLRVLFVDTETEPVLRIYQFDDLGYQYLECIGDPSIVHCKCCGKLIKKTSCRKDYCDECAVEARKSSNRKASQKRRDAVK